jgi:hypothetical protein
LIGLTFRTFWAAVSDRVTPFAVQEALAIRSPLKAPGPEVTVKVALALAPGATGPATVADVLAAAVHCLGKAMLNLTSVTGVPEAFLKVTVASCEEFGENV